MPELPEVETIRRDLEREVAGRKIKDVEVHGTKSIRRHSSKKQFINALDGKKIKSVGRKGKYLVFQLDDDDVLVAHLGMSGRLLRAPTKREVEKHTHVIITFTQGGQLRFVDPRTFGEMFVTAADELTNEVPELADLGLDPVTEPVSWVEFARRLQGRTTKLKPLLLDQKFLAGIGNIYSDEILHTAGLRHDRSADSLSPQEIRRLYRAVVEILHDAIKHRGSTLADQQYVDVFGEPGGYQQFHEVYDREGEACRRCRGVVVKEKVSSRSTFFCPDCQV